MMLAGFAFMYSNIAVSCIVQLYLTASTRACYGTQRLEACCCSRQYAAKYLQGHCHFNTISGAGSIPEACASDHVLDVIQYRKTPCRQNPLGSAVPANRKKNAVSGFVGCRAEPCIA